MSVAEALGLMFTFGLFILAMLTYIDRNQKKVIVINFSRLNDYFLL